MNRPDVTITVVSYNTRELLRACLKSIPAGAGALTVEVHVVDNGSHDGSVQMVREDFPEVRLFANTENLGFAQANNQSWEESTGRFWFLLNSDAELKPRALEALIQFAEERPRAGLVSARLENPDGTPQLCAHMEPSSWRIWLEISRLHKLVPARLRGRLLGAQYFSYDEPATLGYAWGTALLARREAVEQAGPLDEAFWMYGEDLEWSLRLRGEGWQVWFCPEARVLHHGGQSSKDRWTAPEKLRRQWDAHYHAIALHRGPEFTRRLMRAHRLSLQAEERMNKLRGQSNPDIAPLVDYLRRAIAAPVLTFNTDRPVTPDTARH